MALLGGVILFLSVLLFAIFPLTDTDIWWHLACAREWVTTWTPVRAPVVNVHEYFQHFVYGIYGLGGAPLVVAVKAFLWMCVFGLFLWPVRKNFLQKGVHGGILAAVLLLFVFRYQFEMRPVLVSLLFLGAYWNILPWLLNRVQSRSLPWPKILLTLVAVLLLQWTWCKCQGLYILGPLYAMLLLACRVLENGNFWRSRNGLCGCAFVALLFAIPFLHGEGWRLFVYPFGLLDRLLGMSDSAAIFASQIAENRSPFTLLLSGENVAQSILMVAMALFSVAFGMLALIRKNRNADIAQVLCLLTVAVLALVAERNFVLFLPVFFAVVPFHRIPRAPVFVVVVFLFALLGFWCRSLAAYDASMVSSERVPVAAAEWTKSHPHSGRLFNDDRAGGYLAFINPSDSIYIDGRFILKTSTFFERYLQYADSVTLFVDDADSLGMDRVVLPLRYYARWNLLIAALKQAEGWQVSYVDNDFIVIDRINLR